MDNPDSSSLQSNKLTPSVTPRTHQLAVRTLKIQQNYLARLRSQEENEDDYDSDAADVDPPDSMAALSDHSKLDKAKMERLDPKLIGMSVGFKNLYSGKEDRRGRFQWQETVPEDLVPPAENAETQKWAFIARYVKLYGDPRKTLALHSIVIQSPLLKKVLEEVLAGYPNVTVGLQRLEFSGRFECLIHRFPDLNSVIEKLRDQVKETESAIEKTHGSDEHASASISTSEPADMTVNAATNEHAHVESIDKNDVPNNAQTSHKDKRGKAAGLTDNGLSAAADGTAAEITASSSDNVKSPDEPNGTPKVDGTTEIEKPIESEVKATPEPVLSETELTMKHAELLRDLLVTEFQGLIESSTDMKAHGVITYETLWALFEPGHLIYAREEGQDRVFNLISGKEGLDQDDNPVFWLSVRYIDFDGTRFGWRRAKVSIAKYEGTCAIASLSAYPLEYHTDKEGLREKLVSRGSAIEAFTGTHYRSYDGIGWRLDQYGQKERHSVKGRIIIDTIGWNRYQPNSAVFVSALNSSGLNKSVLGTRTLFLPSLEEALDSVSGDFGGMPLDGHFNEDEDQKKAPALTDEQKILCTHLIRGYALKEKMWLNLFVNSVQDVVFNGSAFEALVLPENTKELILGFACTQQAYRNSYDDVIQGKGRGIILLLCGPPGVGKTLTAESVAEEMKVPLFVMSAADLGMDTKHIEARLLSVLGMCTRWNAILLLDEADIFLEARSRHEVERNKLVSIFLRVLEYHEGIMFLTTNRVDTFDPAFQSRIHISIDYPDLSPDSRRTIWENFLRRHDEAQASARLSPPRNPASSIKAAEASSEQDEEAAKAKHDALTQPHVITKQEIRQLSLIKLNGRQIKNMLKTSQLLANRKAEALSYAHIKTVLDATQHLHNAEKAAETARSSIFN